ncbi:esterase B1-like [Musca vetustissima]|uniref:esterase B1-like n=1 Tax=Musca vetustissima TaxID=27455 RepID=UPI002AB6D1AB|nr:esterase B1-like [Musca vetustissima]
MDVYIGPIDKLKIVLKFIAHRYHYYNKATNHFVTTKTSGGSIRGRKRKNVYREYDIYYSFEGIPYAKPPLGELRFRAPQPPEPWKNVRDCLHIKTKPMQYDYITKMIMGSEDCLYLNVYVKKFNTPKPLPVMIWIYGGGFNVGEASWDLYAPDYFMQKDVVVVTFNYRLGIFGFVCFDDPDLNIPGNAGLKDQVLALKWVKENIHNFNGDPNNITVFGESAGAASTQLMMSTPQTKGLFHKAILQSGSFLCPWSFTDNHKWAHKIASQFGYHGDSSDKDIYKFLKTKSSKSLTIHDLKYLSKDEHMSHMLFHFAPVVEPYHTEHCVVDKPFKELLSTAWGNHIPLIVGGNSAEGLLFYNVTKYNKYLMNDLSDLVNLLPNDVQQSQDPEKLKAMGQQLQKLYFNGKQPNFNDNFSQYLELKGHVAFWHPILRTIQARQHYAPNSPVFCYYFDFDSIFFNHFRRLSCGNSVRGVCHADDVLYLFYTVLSDGLNRNSEEYKCIQRLIGMWYNFALTSDPNCNEIEPVIWKPVTADNSAPIKSLIINKKLDYDTLPAHEKIRKWNDFYTPGNLF